MPANEKMAQTEQTNATDMDSMEIDSSIELGFFYPLTAISGF